MAKNNQPVQVFFGNREISKLKERLEQAGLKDALLITGANVQKSGLANQVKELAGSSVLEVAIAKPPNASVANIDEMVGRIKSLGAKSIIALGGGSIIDLAKAVGAAYSQNLRGSEMLKQPDIMTSLPVVAIPTLSGAGSEVTRFAVIAEDGGEPVLLQSDAFYPKIALVDPKLTYSAPPKVTAISGIDVIVHALDSLGSVRSNIVSESLALRAARMAFENLAAAVEDGADPYAREQMAMASLLSGTAFSLTGTAGAYACSKVLVTRYGIPHGEACAFTLDTWYRVNAQVKPKLDDYAREMGFEDADVLADEFARLKSLIGLRTTLEQIGVSEGELDEVVAWTMETPNILNAIANIGAEGVREVFLSKRA
ncbi:MAG: iron-containing alcohol dehydrogenase [Turicibacter sp.]|nr:iron-containing alcohol dehydrogenase [Turicibacter sp.]